eukprot:TRINITY_DN7737_c0_g1_i4.p1 TRINITY_DN7737_c0_g1~~TRINITY_DN7737_c0_g1_i4.p1  ORF type:complete len:426 (-),score=61.37 TRINITY_DN7737_c0_g1_i4:126-1403(-)
MDRVGVVARSNSAPSRPLSMSSSTLPTMPSSSRFTHPNHSGHLLLTTGWASDFELHVGVKVYHLHKFVLEQASTYFSRIVRSTPVSDPKNPVIKHLIKPRTDIAHFERAVRLIYTKDFANELRTVEEAMGLLKVAYEINFEEAVEECISFLKDNATFDDLEKLEALTSQDKVFSGLMASLTSSKNNSVDNLVEKGEALRKRVLRTLYLIRKEPQSTETIKSQEACELEFRKNCSRGHSDINTRVLQNTFIPTYLIISNQNELTQQNSIELHPGLVWMTSLSRMYGESDLLFKILCKFSEHQSLTGVLTSLNPSSPRFQLHTYPNIDSFSSSNPSLTSFREFVKYVLSFTPDLLRNEQADVERVVQLFQWARKTTLIEEGEYDALLCNLIKGMKVSEHVYFFDVCHSVLEKIPTETNALIARIRDK